MRAISDGDMERQDEIFHQLQYLGHTTYHGGSLEHLVRDLYCYTMCPKVPY